MVSFLKSLGFGLALLTLSGRSNDVVPSTRTSPEYTADSQLKLPAQYRRWVYLTSGFDMSYAKGANTADHHMFDNVFVNPEAYEAFLQTGTWPDKTMLVLEVRGAEGRGSINQSGNFQSSVMGLEVHVKDEARFPGKWAFFGFDDEKPAKMIPPAPPATAVTQRMQRSTQPSFSSTQRCCPSQRAKQR